MSSPAPDTYFIYSRVLNENGQRLAMTFNGDNKSITVTPLDTAKEIQQWVIVNFQEGTQHVRPKSRQDLEAGWAVTIETMPLGGYVWNITGDHGYVIKDGGRKVMWTINNAVNDAAVTPVADPLGEKQRWVFHKVGTPLN